MTAAMNKGWWGAQCTWFTDVCHTYWHWHWHTHRASPSVGEVGAWQSEVSRTPFTEDLPFALLFLQLTLNDRCVLLRKTLVLNMMRDSSRTFPTEMREYDSEYNKTHELRECYCKGRLTSTKPLARSGWLQRKQPHCCSTPLYSNTSKKRALRSSWSSMSMSWVCRKALCYCLSLPNIHLLNCYTASNYTS